MSDKKDVVESAWRFLKVIGDLKLARTFQILWNTYPAEEFVERNYHGFQNPT